MTSNNFTYFQENKLDDLDVEIVSIILDQQDKDNPWCWAERG